ncbi:hypothetical protein GBA52_025344 [Prunus armeniaca]|nr:hypothetical protein GBA52_025344 [Prunus armeniaca]
MVISCPTPSPHQLHQSLTSTFTNPPVKIIQTTLTISRSCFGRSNCSCPSQRTLQTRLSQLPKPNLKLMALSHNFSFSNPNTSRHHRHAHLPTRLVRPSPLPYHELTRRLTEGSCSQPSHGFEGRSVWALGSCGAPRTWLIIRVGALFTRRVVKTGG